MGRRYCKFIYGGVRKTCPAVDGRVTLKWMLEITGEGLDRILVTNGIDAIGELLTSTGAYRRFAWNVGNFLTR